MFVYVYIYIYICMYVCMYIYTLFGISTLEGAGMYVCICM
jgi:hypothetical protein